jgi:hypothetical protein
MGAPSSKSARTDHSLPASPRSGSRSVVGTCRMSSIQSFSVSIPRSRSDDSHGCIPPSSRLGYDMSGMPSYSSPATSCSPGPLRALPAIALDSFCRIVFPVSPAPLIPLAATCIPELPYPTSGTLYVGHASTRQHQRNETS